MGTWPEARAAKESRQRREAASKPPPSPPAPKKPKWRADLPLIVMKGGPRAGHWYFAEEGNAAWSQFVASARAHWDLNGPPTTESDSVLGYVATGNSVDHPRLVGADNMPLQGQVWLWAPDRAAARERRYRDDGNTARRAVRGEHAAGR